MDLISLILIVAIVGVLVWAIITYLPMPEPFPKVIVAVAVIVMVLYVLRVLALTPPNVLGR
jgi:hypothetical protein